MTAFYALNKHATAEKIKSWADKSCSAANLINIELIFIEANLHSVDGYCGKCLAVL
jgi:hypothetical protein